MDDSPVHQTYHLFVINYKRFIVDSKPSSKHGKYSIITNFFKPNGNTFSVAMWFSRFEVNSTHAILIQCLDI